MNSLYNLSIAIVTNIDKFLNHAIGEKSCLNEKYRKMKID